MHELSLAESLLELADRNVPAGSVLRVVKVRAGPRRMIDPDVMNTAWDAILKSRGRTGIALALTLTPWTLECPICSACWPSSVLDAECPRCHIAGSPLLDRSHESNVLKMTSIEVDDTDPTGTRTNS